MAGAQQELPLVLTPEEQAWLAEQHTVRVRVADNAPSTFIVDGKAVGIAPEFLEAISKRTGIKFRFIIPSPSFSEDLDGLIQHTGPDVIPSLQRTSERATNVLFTQAYMSSPRFIFARDDAPFIGALEELSGRSVAVVEDYLVEGWLSQHYPNIDVQLHQNIQSALKAVSSGDAFAFIGPLRSTTYIINRLGLSNLKAFSQTSLPVTDSQTSLPVAETSMGVRSDWPELRSIIDKGLDAIPASEKAAIVNRWSTVKLEHRVQTADVLKWVLVVVGVGVAVVLMFAVWNRSLRRRVLERTEQLSESEQRFRATFEQAAVGIAHVSASGQLVRVNQKFCDIVGYPQEEILKKTFQQITHADDLDEDMHNVRRLLAGEAESYGMEKRYVHKSGDLVWVYLRVSLVRDKARQKEWFVSVIEDITKRKNAEEALRSSQRSLAASEERFRQLVQQSPLSVEIFSPDGRIEEVNKAFSDLWGIPDEDLPEVLANYNVLEDEEARKHGVMPLIEKAFKGEAVILPAIEYDAGETMNAIGVNTEAKKVWIQARLYPILNDKGDVVRVVDLEEDVTEHKRAKENERRFQALIEQSPLAIEVHSVDGKFLMSNPAYSRITGLHGAALEAVYESFDLRHDMQQQSLGHGPLLDRLYAGEVIEFPPYAYNVSEEAATLGIPVPDDGLLWIRSFGFPLKDVGGRTEAVVLMSQDITDIKAAEQELQKYQQRLRALGLEMTISEERERRRIATELHDEAAQSLALARLKLAAAAKRVGDEATRSKLDDASQLLKDSLQQIRELVLDLSSPALNEIGLAAATSEWVEEHLCRQHGLSASFTDNCGDLEFDHDVLALLFRNTRELLTNVVKHAQATRVSVRFDCIGDAFRITVADDGRGLAASETMRTPSDEGGFGLFSVRERVRDLGGTLEIESAPGKGCTVRMTLPLERLRERRQL